MKTLETFLKDPTTSPVQVFEAMASHDLLAQFVSANIPEATAASVAIVGYASDEVEISDTLNAAFLAFCLKHHLVYDDFPPNVRTWDHEQERKVEYTGTYLPLEWDDTSLPEVVGAPTLHLVP